MFIEFRMKSVGLICKISYDDLTIYNAIVTIDLQWMSHLLNILGRTQGMMYTLNTIHLQNRKIVSDSVSKLHYNILKGNFSTF